MQLTRCLSQWAKNLTTISSTLQISKPTSDLIDKYSQFCPSPISLRQFIDFGESCPSLIFVKSAGHAFWSLQLMLKVHSLDKYAYAGISHQIVKCVTIAEGAASSSLLLCLIFW